MLAISLQDVEQFLPEPLQESELPRAEGWVSVLTAILNQRYGDAINPTNQIIFTSFVAAVIVRKLANPNEMVASESVNQSQVTWSTMSSKGYLFLPEEITTMDNVTGYSRRGIRSIGTPAPDYIRRSNLL